MLRSNFVYSAISTNLDVVSAAEPVCFAQVTGIRGNFGSKMRVSL